MNLTEITTRDAWLTARKELLGREEARMRSGRGWSESWEEPQGRAPRLHGADPTFTD